MNPHAPHPATPASLVKNLWKQRGLIAQMTKRDVIGRYKGSVMGVMWSLFNPLFLLVIYTFVFSTVFKARWATGATESKSEFAILLFVGMIVHGLFAETLSRAPTLILSNVSYVKKIVFPLDILPIVAIGAALFHSAVSVAVLLSVSAFLNGYVPWTAFLLPVVMLPLVLLTLGLAWILASLGVYLRDIAQPIGLVMTVLLFASPVFYPVSALPGFIQPWIILNPLTFIIEESRKVLVFGQQPHWTGLGLYVLVALASAWAGYAWFQKTRKGFANVL